MNQCIHLKTFGCHLGNATSPEWCFCKERCCDYTKTGCDVDKPEPNQIAYAICNLKGIVDPNTVSGREPDSIRLFMLSHICYDTWQDYEKFGYMCVKISIFTDNQFRLLVHDIRKMLAEELLGYRKKHAAVYGDSTTYHDEGEYLKNIIKGEIS